MARIGAEADEREVVPPEGLILDPFAGGSACIRGRPKEPPPERIGYRSGRACGPAATAFSAAYFALIASFAIMPA